MPPIKMKCTTSLFEHSIPTEDTRRLYSDYLTAHSKGDLAAVVRSTPTYRGDELRLTSIGELLAESDDEIEWVVENRIAPASTNVVAGAPKTGKSNARRCEIR